MRDPTLFRRRYGPRALVTGAARGLGAEFARQLARRGLDLLLLDLDPPEALARELRGPVRVRSVGVDLARPDLLEILEPLLADLELGLVVCNAGLSTSSPFLQMDLELKLRQLDVNSRAPLMLAHALGRPMLDRGRGGIVLLSSLSATCGVPLVAGYAATKAFNQVLGEGLWAELRRGGVDVLVLAPGLTLTPGMQALRPTMGSLPGRMTLAPEPVVAGALDALGRGPLLIPGLLNRLSSALLGRLLPRPLAIGLMHRSMSQLFPDAG